MKLDTGAELDVTECAEVAGVELGGGTDLSGGRGKWWSAATMGGASTSQRGTRLGRRRRRQSARAKSVLRSRAEAHYTE
jgi:hypothetical protein